MFAEYLAYLRDNPDGYWFKRRLYGWGWTPARWQGWAVIALYLGGLFYLARGVDNSMTFEEVLWPFLIPLVILTGLFILVCYQTGEKPRWQWGLPKKQ